MSRLSNQLVATMLAQKISPQPFEALVDAALREDLGSGLDATTVATIPANQIAIAQFNTQCPVDCLLSTTPCTPIVTASVAFRKPTPTCSGCICATCSFVCAVANSALPTTLRGVYPTATGRTPPRLAFAAVSG
jgi:hypothetical protein